MKNPSLGPRVCLFAVSGCNAVAGGVVVSKRERIVVTAAPARAG
jgi:hypothetical protein